LIIFYISTGDFVFPDVRSIMFIKPYCPICVNEVCLMYGCLLGDIFILKGRGWLAKIIHDEIEIEALIGTLEEKIVELQELAAGTL
jgi:hypothetical protein